MVASKRLLTWLLAASTALAGGGFMRSVAHAQVRIEPAPAQLINAEPTDETRNLFERGGLFSIAGGVMPQGHAAFFLEQDGETPVPAADMRAVALPGGDVAVAARKAEYKIAMPHGLACPLGQFVARDGMVAYTVPKFIGEEAREAMLRQGLVHHRIAREFDGTPFERLLKAADFGDTQALPPGLSDRLVAGIDRVNGIGGGVLTAADDQAAMVGSYLNSGAQVTYKVYLMPGTLRAEIGGVPLRYYWKLEQDGSAGVFSVEMYAQNWSAESNLTNWMAEGARPTQYDVVNFYQIGGLFWQLHESNRADFADFVEQVCASSH